MSEPLSDSADASASGLEHYRAILRDFERAGTTDSTLARVAQGDDIRYTRWPGQSTDGRRWDENQEDGKPVLPYNGAPDTRIPLSDEIIGEEVDLLVTAFWLADLKFSPMGMEDVATAKLWRKYFEWLVYTRMFQELNAEVELSAQYRGAYGWCVLHIDYRRELGFRRQTITLEQLGGMDPLFPLLIGAGTPETDQVAVDMLTQLYRQYAEQQSTGVDAVEIPVLKASAARKAIRELRKQGKASVALPYLCENRPRVKALKPYAEVVVCWGSGGIQEARGVYPCEWFTEAELKATGEAEQWDADWLAAALLSKGKRSAWTWDQQQMGVSYQVITQEKLELIEVCYGYTKVVDEDGCIVIRRVTFCPAVKDRFAASEDLEHLGGEYPFAEVRRERLGRMVTDTRSISEVAGPWQDELKTHADALSVYAELSTTPPILGPKLGFNYRFGPSGYVGDSRAASIKPLDLTKPGGQAGSLQVIEMVRLRAARYFCRPDPAVPPIVTQLRRQRIAGQFFACWASAFKLMFRLVRHYADPQEVQRVTGRAMPSDEGVEYDVILHYDTRFMDPDFLKNVMEHVNQQILPLDSTGSTNRAALTKWMWQAIDPDLAEQLTDPQEQATQRMQEQVAQETAMMFLGNEAQYVAEDPAAGAKLQILQQIVAANPNYMAALQSNERFQALMKNYGKNLAMSVEQQQNKMTGRTGVKPVDQQPGGGMGMMLGKG